MFCFYQNVATKNCSIVRFFLISHLNLITMLLKAIYGKIPQTIELSDGRVLHLVQSSFEQPTTREPYVNFKWGTSLVNHKELCAYFGNFVPTKIFFSIPDSCGNIRISENVYESMKRRFDKYQEKQRKLNLCAKLNNIGINLEKAGDIEAAIAIYELNISGSCYPAVHSFNRLLVLYHKSKNYKAEKRVCQKALRIFRNSESLAIKYSNRLAKITELLGEHL